MKSNVKARRKPNLYKHGMKEWRREGKRLTLSQKRKVPGDSNPAKRFPIQVRNQISA